MRSILMAIAAGCLLAACSDPASKMPEETKAQLADTGFITENPAGFEATRLAGEDVPRDKDGRPFAYDLLGERAPAFALEDLDGDIVTERVFRGQWTVVDVWGLWCGDCLVDSPYVAALATAIEQDPDLAFLSIHTPPSKARYGDAYGRFGSIEAFFEQKGYSYPTLIDEDASVRDQLLIAWTPSYLLIDPDGVIRGYRTDLSVSGDDAVKDFLQAVAKVRADAEES